jgi:hypothetical protein
MFGNDAPYKLCFTFRQSIDRDESGSLFAIAYLYLCLAIALEYMNMRRLMIVRPENELKTVDEKDGWHVIIIPVRLGYFQLRTNAYKGS